MKRAATKYARGCVVCVAILGALTVVVGAPVVSHVSNEARRASSTNNLKQMGLVMAMYSADDPVGAFPAPTPRAALATPDLSLLYPDYLTEFGVLLAPSWYTGNEPFVAAAEDWPAYRDEAESLVAANYVYFGYGFSSEAELNSLLDAIPQLARQYPRSLDVPGGPPLLSLGAAKNLSKETPPSVDASKIVVMFENPRLNGAHETKINVLYLDGRAAIVPRKDFFPNAHFDRLPPDPADG